MTVALPNFFDTETKPKALRLRAYTLIQTQDRNRVLQGLKTAHRELEALETLNDVMRNSNISLSQHRQETEDFYNLIFIQALEFAQEQAMKIQDPIYLGAVRGMIEKRKEKKKNDPYSTAYLSVMLDNSARTYTQIQSSPN